MSDDVEANGGDTVDANIEDTEAIASETKNLVIEARSSLVILICALLIVSLLSILLSTWLAKTIAHSPSSFGTILSRYFGFDRNDTEKILTWWTPIRGQLPEVLLVRTVLFDHNQSTSTIEPATVLRNSYDDYPRFHTIVLPLLFIGAIVLAVLAYYARVRCTHRNFAWGAVPKIPMGRVDPKMAAAAAMKGKEAEAGVDYTIVQGTKQDPVMFALAETLEPLTQERPVGGIVDEASQYDADDIPKVITHIASAPDLHTNSQTVPSLSSPSNEQQHAIEMLQRQPLPTLASRV